MASPPKKGGLPSEQPPPSEQGGRKGHISEELQLQAKKSEKSPVVSELFVSARKGYTAEVLRELREGGPERATAVDKVSLHAQTHVTRSLSLTVGWETKTHSTAVASYSNFTKPIHVLMSK